jgi:hypothetical protein
MESAGGGEEVRERERERNTLKIKFEITRSRTEKVMEGR